MLVSAVHFRPLKGEPEQNAATLHELMRAALDQGAQLVVAPELSASGFAFASRDEMAPFAPPLLNVFRAALADLSGRAGAIIVAGAAESGAVSGRLYNIAYVAVAGTVFVYRAPLFPHNYGWVTGFGEPGADVSVMTPAGLLGVRICAGLTLAPWPDAPPALMAVPASWNDDPPGDSLRRWQEAARQRSCAVIIANRHGVETFASGAVADFSRAVSCITDRQGRVLAATDPSLQHDQIILAELPAAE